MGIDHLTDFSAKYIKLLRLLNSSHGARSLICYILYKVNLIALFLYIHPSTFSIQLQLVSSPPFPSAVGSSCEVRSVGPIPPYPVTEIQLLSTSRNFSQDGRTVAVTASFNWTAPEFSGEDIVGYQVWLDRRPAPDNVTRSITHGPRERFAEIEVSFDVDDEDFYIILQVYYYAFTCLHVHYNV